MKRLIGFALLAFFAVAAASCATMTAGFHADRGANLAHYATWDWGPADPLPVGDPRLADNTFFKDHFEGAVEKRLTTLGFTRTPEGVTPELLVHYHANIAERFFVNESVVDCAPGNCEPQTIEYEQGTLVLDVMNVKNEKLVWRGWAQRRFELTLKNQDRLERQINEAVTKILEHFSAGTATGPGASAPAQLHERMATTPEG